LNFNYGGILQNYALQTVLKNMGHEVVTLYTEQKMPAKKQSVLFFKYFVKKLLHWKGDNYRPLTSKQKNAIKGNTKNFVEKYISVTKPLHWVYNELNNELQLDAYIVGSDQVWRPDFVHNIYDMYFQFLQNDKVKKISYAASFGVNTWEYSTEQQLICAELIKKFDGISVREKSGVALCKEYFNVNALHLLDPTLLLSADDYKKLIPVNKKNKTRKQLTVYILDFTSEKREILNYISKKLNLSVTYVGNEFSDKQNIHYTERIAPPVENWLEEFDNADFIFTDSFHGTAFSIIFNKPFISIGNPTRGIERFTSLLDLFNISDRLLIPDNKNIDFSLIDAIVNKPIDFKYINEVRTSEVAKSFEYLTRNLTVH
jgi:hypothetical protein